MVDRVDIRWRALPSWPANYPQTATWDRPRCPFRTVWSKTLDDLDRELFHVDARHVVVELDLHESQMTKAGRPRADAIMRTPGVVLQFERGKDRLIFPCDTYNDWQDNVRAIALTLNALRMMERYGTTSGRQYQGFKALPSQGSTTLTTEGAKDTIRRYAGENGNGDWASRVRSARNAAHPDRGGSHDAFVAVQEAERTLRAAGVLT